MSSQTAPQIDPKTSTQNAFQQAVATLIHEGLFDPAAGDITLQIERSKDPKHGDLACNIAMQLARVLRKKPRDIAAQLLTPLQANPLFERIEIAGPGFINVYLSQTRYADWVAQILDDGEAFGTVATTADAPSVLLEFVSANPTGPLHVGHGRGAAYGATLANILRAAGQRVDCEYYVNDAGRQMDILALSVYLRYLECGQVPVIYPLNAYQADYVRRIAADIFAAQCEQSDESGEKNGGQWLADEHFFADLCIADYDNFSTTQKNLSTELAQCETRLTDTDTDTDKACIADKQRIETIKATLAEQKVLSERFIDQLIVRAKDFLGKDYAVFFDAALNCIRDDIEDDLRHFGVEYQRWFSERTLFADGKIARAIEVLDKKGYLYEKNGAIWFKTRQFGDEKDRVVRRDNGVYTYFASDIAYHHDKIERGYDLLIDVFGADHHGYMARVKAALAAFGHDTDKLRFELVQFAVLYKGGEKMSMSTRSGKYVTLRDLRGMIGNTAARFFYVSRKPQQHMDFDLDLAVQNNKDNPLYYIQYGHARICSLLAKATASGLAVSGGASAVSALDSEHELALLRLLEQYPETIQAAARDYAPQQIIHYLKALATALHSYYDAGNIKFLSEDHRQAARFALLDATRQVLANGLQLTGVDAPETM